MGYVTNQNNKIVAEASSNRVSRWIFAYSYFAFDNVFLKWKMQKKIKKTLKRKKRDLDKKRNKRLLHLWIF